MVDDMDIGLDWISCEFYKFTWAFMKKDLLNVYHGSLHKLYLGAIINQGMIIFTPKVWDHGIITNWKPITMIKISHKIITNALALHIKYIVPNIILFKHA